MNALVLLRALPLLLTGTVACVRTTQVPVRACVLKGADLALNPVQPASATPAGSWASSTTTKAIDYQLSRAMDRTWIPGPLITFPRAVKPWSEDGPIPIIDVTFDRQKAGTVIPGAFNSQVKDVVEACRAAWAPNGDGLVVVWIRDFVLSPLGVPAANLGVTIELDGAIDASRTAAICRDPASVTADELASVGVLVLEPTAFGSTSNKHQGDPVAVLAHELGHALLLGHGDGQDTDADGGWDQHCDPDEDENGKPYSLMTQGTSKLEPLTALQIEWARRVAPRYRGAILP